jgi:hypothetical protein
VCLMSRLPECAELLYGIGRFCASGLYPDDRQHR